jgi:hypothetical protein
MGYTVDLTIILQILFWLSQPAGMTVDTLMVEESIKIYRESAMLKEVHGEIHGFVTRRGFLDTLRKEEVVQEIIRLLAAYRPRAGVTQGSRAGFA